MRLEGLGSRGRADNVPLEIKSIKKNGKYQLKTSELIVDIIKLLENGNYKKKDIAAKFQIEIGRSFADIAIKLAKEHNINKIGLTGGVAYNHSFSKSIKDQINQSGYQFLEHELIPPGDAGISTGQLIGGLFKYYTHN